MLPSDQRIQNGSKRQTILYTARTTTTAIEVSNGKDTFEATDTFIADEFPSETVTKSNNNENHVDNNSSVVM